MPAQSRTLSEVKFRRDITELPALPPSVVWVLPRQRKLSWSRYIHVAHRSLELTLCGRVRPGETLTYLPPTLPFCPRCLYRAGALWQHRG